VEVDVTIDHFNIYKLAAAPQISWHAPSYTSRDLANRIFSYYDGLEDIEIEYESPLSPYTAIIRTFGYRFNVKQLEEINLKHRLIGFYFLFEENGQTYARLP
jgi:hypothetical protein